MTRRCSSGRLGRGDGDGVAAGRPSAFGAQLPTVALGGRAGDSAPVRGRLAAGPGDRPARPRSADQLWSGAQPPSRRAGEPRLGRAGAANAQSGSARPPCHRAAVPTHRHRRPERSRRGDPAPSHRPPPIQLMAGTRRADRRDARAGARLRRRARGDHRACPALEGVPGHHDRRRTADGGPGLRRRDRRVERPRHRVRRRCSGRQCTGSAPRPRPDAATRLRPAEPGAAAVNGGTRERHRAASDHPRPTTPWTGSAQARRPAHPAHRDQARAGEQPADPAAGARRHP
jgi:hypothetical protein